MYIMPILVIMGMFHKPIITEQSGIVVNNAQIMTKDGNIWDYNSDYKSNTLISVKITDMGTDDIRDDVIIEVKDMYTAIYDRLEEELSDMDGYIIVRKGNNIIIKDKE